jgi:putative flippase GtrA
VGRSSLDPVTAAISDMLVSNMQLPERAAVFQFVRYGFVGLIQNATNVGFYALAIGLGVPYLLAAVISAVIALALSFVLNRRWTFAGASGRARSQAARYVAVWIGFLVFALPMLALLVQVAHLPKVLAQVVIIAIGAPVSYLLQRHWSFGPDGSSLLPRKATDPPADGPSDGLPPCPRPAVTHSNRRPSD